MPTRMKRTHRSRPYLKSLLLLFLAAATVLWWLRERSPQISSRALDQSGAEELGESKKRKHHTSPPFATASADPTAPEPIDENGPGQQYMTMYNGRSGRLPTGIEPSLRYAPKVIQSDGEPPLLMWLTRDRIELGETTTVHVRSPNPRISIRTAEATFLSPMLAHPVAVKLTPNRSITEFEGVFRADERELSLSRSASSPPALVDVAVRAIGLNAEGREYVKILQTPLFVQRAGAQILVDSPRIDLRNGSLYLEFLLDVKQAGMYYAQVELWVEHEGKSVSLAFARQSFDRLEPGRRALDLMVGGRVIRDSGIDGPYTFRNLEVLRVDSVPPHMAAPIAEVLETPAWPGTIFR
jgi:hypothetical protein